MQNITEEWRDIRDWEGLYQVSNLGRVRGVPRSHVRLSKGGKPTVYRYGYRLLRPGKKDTGYLLVVLSDVTNGRQKVAGVHRLVCEAFHGPKPSWEYEVAHSDHVRHNNAASNLRWATHQDNIQDSTRDGRRSKSGRGLAENYSGVVGVSWDKFKRKWAVQFGSKCIGKFKDFKDAVTARQRAEQESGSVEIVSAA
jgi:hypothetical protein